MLKLFIKILFVYMLLQYVFNVDINQYISSFISPKLQQAGLANLDLEKLGISEDMLKDLSADEIKSLLEDSGISEENAEQKLKQIEEELKKQLEKAKEQIDN